ncbi:hypothetical protein [Actinomadura opuntiae]|uniref:hypothetical protein n=1 Tax=Actinomadura sp. OS1-43 TaxID=604315 RepID=UPI00255A7D74|nr:hypothetical protein [Actinomadura sp. OS1-43]MDL4813168.1 hypothetical protein [Actinomadura sp. OS1-43]
MNRSRVAPVTAAAVAALSVATVGIASSALASHGDNARPAARSAAAKPAKHWFLHANDYQRQHPPTTAQRKSAQAAPHVTDRGPASHKLQQALAPLLAAYIARINAAQDIGSGAQTGGSVTWKAKNGGFLAASTQKLTEPLPIEFIGGDKTTQVHTLSSGTQYVIIDRSPVLIQAITVRPDGRQLQITFGATRPHGQPLPTAANLQRLVTKLDSVAVH